MGCDRRGMEKGREQGWSSVTVVYCKAKLPLITAQEALTSSLRANIWLANGSKRL